MAISINVLQFSFLKTFTLLMFDEHPAHFFDFVLKSLDGTFVNLNRVDQSSLIFVRLHLPLLVVELPLPLR